MKSHKLVRNIIVILWGIIVCLLWKFYHWGQLNFHEQMQLFLLTPDYFYDTVFCVGGFANYISQFLIQFFIFPWIGSIIISLLVVGIQIFSFKLLKYVSDNYICFVLSFIPSIISYCILGNIEMMPTGLFALLWGLIFAHFLLKINSLKMQSVLLFILGIIIFLLFGTAAMFVTMLSVISINFSLNKIKLIQFLVMILSIFVIWIVTILIVRFFGSYSFLSYMKGQFYMRDCQIFPLGIYIAVSSIFIVNIISKVTSKINKNDFKIAILLSIIVTIIGIVQSKKCYHNTEQILEYDCLARYKKWDKIIELANKEKPRWYTAENYLYLALAKTNKLTTYAFHYSPHNSSSLYIPFMRDHYFAISAGEVLYYLGLINTSRRYFSEAQGSILNKNLSCRYTMRIAEIDMLNKDYKLAEKHLRLLTHTLFYRGWAEDRLKFCKQKTEFDQDSEYGQIRNFMLINDKIENQDYFYRLSQLIMQNDNNTLAWDYLLMHKLLDRDIEGVIPMFVKYAEKYGNNLPQIFQEGVLLSWLLSHKTLNGFPYSVSINTMNKFKQFSNTMDRNPNIIYSLLSDFDNTFWYYYFSKK